METVQTHLPLCILHTIDPAEQTLVEHASLPAARSHPMQIHDSVSSAGTTGRPDPMMRLRAVTHRMWRYEINVAAIDIGQLSSSSILHLLQGTDGAC